MHILISVQYYKGEDITIDSSENSLRLPINIYTQPNPQIHPPTHLIMLSYIHPTKHTPTHPLNHSCIHLSIYSIRSSVHQHATLPSVIIGSQEIYVREHVKHTWQSANCIVSKYTRTHFGEMTRMDGHSI